MKLKTRRPKPEQPATPDAARHYATFKSPIGDLLLVASDTALTGLYFAGHDHVPSASHGWKLSREHRLFEKAIKQLEQYFAGDRTDFDMPLSLNGTRFQEKVWREIARIPYGKTITYSELAGRAGAPEAIRAAGTSTGRNPISIIIPCHRVIGKNGSLCGFAGGLETKDRLLRLEGAVDNDS